MECPVCLDKQGAYLLIGCGHGLCPECIEGIHNSNAQHFACPLCRKTVIQKPVFIQALSEYFDSTIIQSMNQKINMWWSNSESSTTRNIYRDFDNPRTFQTRNETNLNTIHYYTDNYASYLSTTNNLNTNLLNRNSNPQNINNHNTNENTVRRNNVWPSETMLNNSASEEYSSISNNIINDIKNNRILNRNFNTTLSGTSSNPVLYQLNDGWTFTPFSEGPIVINITFPIVCAEKNLNESGSTHRRLIMFLATNAAFANTIESVENSVAHRLSHIGYEFHSEIRYRNTNAVNNTVNNKSICVHTGTWIKPESLRNQDIFTLSNIKIACFGVWTYNNKYGCRWHIV